MVVPVQLTVKSGVMFCLFIVLALSTTTTCGAVENVKTLFEPSTVPTVGRSSVKPPPGVVDVLTRSKFPVKILNL